MTEVWRRFPVRSTQGADVLPSTCSSISIYEEDQIIARRKRQTPAPPPKSPSVWGAVPRDDPSEVDRRHGVGSECQGPYEASRRSSRLQVWLNADLYERERSDAKAVQASLEDLHGKLLSALEALRSLGHDALEAFHRQAKNEIVRDRRENDGAIGKDLTLIPPSLPAKSDTIGWSWRWTTPRAGPSSRRRGLMSHA